LSKILEFGGNANIVFLVAVNDAKSQAGPGLADTATIERKLAPGGDGPGATLLPPRFSMTA
jgi:hypothetical protein